MADPEWLRCRSAQLRDRAEETRQLARVVGSVSTMCWVSPAATRFRQQVESRAGSLVALAGRLEDSADQLDAHARGVELDRVLRPLGMIL